MARTWTEAEMAKAKLLFETTDRSLRRIAREAQVPLTTLREHAVLNSWVRLPGAEAEIRTPARPLAAKRARRTGAGSSPIVRRLRLLLLRQIACAEARARTTMDLATREREVALVVQMTKAASVLEAAQLGRGAARGAKDQDVPNHDAAPVPASSPDEVYQAFAELVSRLAPGDGPGPDAPGAAGAGRMAQPAMVHVGP